MDNDEELDDELNEQKDNVKGIKSFLKKPVTNVANSASGGIKNTIKRVWKSMPTVVKFKVALFAILLIFIIIAAIVLDYIKENNSDTAISYLRNTINSNTADLKLTGICKDYYENRGSLIYFADSDYYRLKEHYKATQKNDKMYKLFSTNDLIDDIFKTEQYNFNKIKWNKYTHEEDNVELKMFNMNPHYNLIMPLEFCITGKVETTEKTFISDEAKKIIGLVQPYLQSWYIPLAAATSTLDSENYNVQGLKSYEFVENIRKYSMSDIELNWYKVKKCISEKNYKKYTQTTTYVNVTVKKDENGNLIKTQGEPYEDVQQIDETNLVEPIKEYQENDLFYIKEAYTFDYWEKSEFEHSRYSDEDVKNNVNPNYEYEAEPEDFTEEEDIVIPEDLGERNTQSSNSYKKRRKKIC